MTIAVDWDIKHKKPKKNYPLFQLHLYYCFRQKSWVISQSISILCLVQFQQFLQIRNRKNREFSEKRMEMKIREEEVSKILSENNGQMKIGNELNSLRLGIDAQKLQVHHVRSALLACPISPPSSVSESLSNSSSSEYSGSHIYPAYPKLSFSSPEAIITR